MIDITDRDSTLRRATAESVVAVLPETAERIRRGDIPKGDVGEMTRAAGLLGLKRTRDLLPYCHAIPLDYASVEVTVEDDAVRIRVQVAAIARTGAEVEAMTGAAVAALNVYDMVKPLDKTAAIGSVRVVTKSGGRTDHHLRLEKPCRAGVLLISDSVADGRAEDVAGEVVAGRLAGVGIDIAAQAVAPDTEDRIAEVVKLWADAERLDLVVCVGGTGVGPRDRTPEALRPLLDREIPGLGEAMRAHGRLRTPLASFSRSLAGQRGDAVVIAVPGSESAVEESFDALLPWLLHLLDAHSMGERHEDDGGMS